MNLFEKCARTFAFVPVKRVRNPVDIVQKILFRWTFLFFSGDVPPLIKKNGRCFCRSNHGSATSLDRQSWTSPIAASSLTLPSRLQDHLLNSGKEELSGIGKVLRMTAHWNKLCLPQICTRRRRARRRRRRRRRRWWWWWWWWWKRITLRRERTREWWR